MIPPGELGFRRQRLATRLRAADQVSAHGDERLAPFWPQGSDDIARAPSPVETAENGLIDFQCVHQRNDIDREHCLLAIARRIGDRKRFSLSMKDDASQAGCLFAHPD
jgi:hypothetical protein